MINAVEDIQTVVLVRRDGVDEALRVTLKDGLVCFVPIVEGNSDYKIYLQWVGEGNTPTIENY